MCVLYFYFKMKILAWLLLPSLLYAEPWSVSEKSPVIEEQILPPNQVWDQNDGSFWNQRFDYGYFFYEKVISPADGPRCNMYPTCADYGYQALQKHGPLLGGWMATDRFMRDNPKSGAYYPPIIKYGRQRLYDPVSENDFWFGK